MAKLSSKNQITIPVEVLRETGVRPGDELEVRAVDGHVEVRPLPDWVEELAGSMPGVWPAGEIRRLRDAWDRP